MRALRSAVVWFGAVAALVLASGCGSSSAPVQSKPGARSPTVRSSPTGEPPTVGGVSARSLEHALLTRGSAPKPTAAACRASTAAERSAAPFGQTSRPLFTCELTLGAERASYAVQVLPNGCFVAERVRPGRAVYGCGAERS